MAAGAVLDDHDEAVTDVIRRLDGWPLAIELGWLADLDLAVIKRVMYQNAADLYHIDLSALVNHPSER